MSVRLPWSRLRFDYAWDDCGGGFVVREECGPPLDLGRHDLEILVEAYNALLGIRSAVGAD